MIERTKVRSMRKAKAAFALALCAALALTAVFAACGSEKSKESASLKTASEIHDHILTLAEFPEMEKLGKDDAVNFFPIDFDKIKNFEVSLASNRAVADEITVFELEDESYRDTLVNILKQSLKRAANAARDYSPKQYEIILKTTVEEKGGFVFFVVNEKSESIVSQIKKLIEG